MIADMVEKFSDGNRKLVAFVYCDISLFSAFFQMRGDRGGFDGPAAFGP
jgi:hypothetical protein